VRSHSKRIYTKLGIHSKQELLSLIDFDSKV
jgi:DNA-binding CsgD family transcriptional regulator